MTPSQSRSPAPPSRDRDARALRPKTTYLVVGALLAALSWSAATAPRSVAETPESVARALLDDALAPLLAARGANALVTIAPADARRASPPCDRFTAHLPPGARMIGRTLVGVRCDGANWQAFVAAEIRVDAPSWTTARALRAGESIAAADLVMTLAPMTQADFDAALALSRGGNAAASRGMASLDGRTPAPLGRIVLRPVAAGRALASADVRDEGRINAGEAVRVVYNGEGFSVSSDGRAVGPADPGATIQIRLASGNVVNGTLRSDHLVELPR